MKPGKSECMDYSEGNSKSRRKETKRKKLDLREGLVYNRPSRSCLESCPAAPHLATLGFHSCLAVWSQAWNPHHAPASLAPPFCSPPQVSLLPFSAFPIPGLSPQFFYPQLFILPFLLCFYRSFLFFWYFLIAKASNSSWQFSDGLLKWHNC